MNKILSRRLIAFSIDFTISSLLSIAIYLLILPLTLYIDRNIIINFINQRDTLMDYFTIILLYFTIQEVLWNRTLGKKIMKLKIVNLNCKRAKIYQIVIRNIFRLTDQLLVIGSIIILFNNHNRRLGDIVSKTIVVEENCKKRSCTNINNS